MDTAVDELRQEIEQLKARLRAVETRLSAQGIRVSAKGGGTKLVRLDESGTKLEVE